MLIFWPISLCNVSLKIVTKAIANHLKRYLQDFIDPCQSDFVSGRLITDNALLAYEFFHHMRLNKTVTKESFAFKLDMSKAYDRVEWGFIERVLLKIKVGESLVRTIMKCVSTMSFSMLINGFLSSSFTPLTGY